MLTKLFQPQRYQVNQETTSIIAKGHPWIFRTQLSSAAKVFANGQWLKLVDSKNEILGYGVYEKDGLIAIRVVKRGNREITREWIHTLIDKALAKRVNVRKYTTAFRAIHGENDGLPGVVVDVYDKVGVLQTYSPTVDALGRYVGKILTQKLGLTALLLKYPSKRKDQPKRERVLFGNPPAQFTFPEGKMRLSVELRGAQKSGTFLDLRGLRKFVSQQHWKNKRVLNLFCYSGTLNLAAELAGAREIWNVDISEDALEFGKKKHSLVKERSKWIAADIFEWVKDLPAKEKFDVIIVDPPLLVAQMKQLPKVMKSVQSLYRRLLPHLSSRGTIIACDCTSRIARKRFQLEMNQTLGNAFRLKTSVLPEEDHPIGFPEGDYLKILVYERSH